MSEYHPPVAFLFTVQLSGETEPAFACQEVSGLDSEIEVEPLLEGGENRIVHRLPKSVKHANIKLKRGLSQKESALIAWIESTMEGDFSRRVETKNLTITLSGEDNKPLATWQVSGAYPVKWSFGMLDAMNNELAVEEVELAYAFLSRSL